MKSKLSKFQSFADSILPLEAAFLCHFEKFEDTEKKAILRQVVQLAKSEHTPISFDINIDKRKYSYVKNWCDTLLKSLDVDLRFEQLIHWEKLIMNDSIARVDEKQLLQLISSTDSSDFNFIKIYDLAKSYRHYLQIRLRYKEYNAINQFLLKYRTDYEFSKLVNEKLNEITQDIINEYHLKKGSNFSDAFGWLTSLFYNDKLDGYNRLLAWIRMVFIAHNKRSYLILDEMFLYFETLITTGKLYSKRIITNFYSQYLLYFASKQDFIKAAEYGFLSIKSHTNDKLYYTNNLAAVLLRSGRFEEALNILKNSTSLATTSLNFHNKIGHAAYTIFALLEAGNAKRAENHAFVFLNAYKKEIFENRWHLFFNAYLKAMLSNGNFLKLIKVYNTCKIAERDESYKDNPNYFPSLPWMFQLASFKLGEISLEELKKSLSSLKSKSFHLNTSINAADLLMLTREVLKNELSKVSLEQLMLHLH